MQAITQAVIEAAREVVQAMAVVRTDNNQEYRMQLQDRWTCHVATHIKLSRR